MRYIIEDTEDGYTLAVELPYNSTTGNRKLHSFAEHHGHGPIEHLYAEAERTFHAMRAEELAR